MSIEMKPKILDNISMSVDPTGTGSEVTVGLNAAHLENLILNADTDPPVTKAVVQEFTLSGGALSIDMTALTDAFGASLTALGLKLQYVHVINPQNNGSLTFTTGATNGLTLPGSHRVVPGSSVGDVHEVWMWPGVVQDVATADRVVDVTGGTTDSFTLALVFG